MGRLNQTIAVNEPRKARATNAIEKAHRAWKPEAINGMTRTYEPLDSEGEKQPPETKVVQLRVEEVLKKVEAEMVAYYDVVATMETGNTTAKSNVVVDDKLIMKNVPVTVLLFFEKQMATTIIPFLRKLPTLSADRDWRHDKNKNCFVTEPIQQNRTRKVPRTHVKYEATKEHPAQCEMYHEDVSVGTWTSTHFSGALQAADKAAMLDRAEKFQDALKTAREGANSMEVDQVKLGQTAWDFVFHGKGGKG